MFYLLTKGNKSYDVAPFFLPNSYHSTNVVVKGYTEQMIIAGSLSVKPMAILVNKPHMKKKTTKHKQ